VSMGNRAHNVVVLRFGLIEREVFQGGDAFRWIYLASERVQLRDNQAYGSASSNSFFLKNQEVQV
jgi:hypothetical protein